MKKEAAIGTWTLARSYFEAGSKLGQDQDSFGLSMPAYFLYGHAIELALKSFLISQGTTAGRLKRIGHDLEEAMRIACMSDAFDIHLSDKHKAVVRMLNPYYRGKELEYLAIGAKTFPVIEEVEATARALVFGVKPPVEAAVRQHLKASHDESAA
jgi:hypothetical protein